MSRAKKGRSVVALAVTGVGILLMVSAGQGRAQDTDPVKTERIYVRAQQLVNDGEGDKGRAIVDSMLTVTKPGTPEHGEALYWHAVLAPTAAIAEHDYKELLVTYSGFPRTESILLRLAQLELTQGARDNALNHLQRLVLEYPNSPGRARASYWLARVLFAKNELAKACAANSEAAARVKASEVELRNQIDYQEKRCASIAAAERVAASSAVADTAKHVVEDTVKDSVKMVSNTRGVRGKGKIVAKPKPEVAKKTSKKATSTKKTLGAKEATNVKATSTKAPIVTKDTAVAGTAAPDTQPVLGKAYYAVQVAAYNDQKGADSLARRLRAAGYDVTVSGGGKPYRVRIGRYATHKEAVQALKLLKEKRHLAGFIVQVEAE